MSHRNPVPQSTESTPEWMNLVSNNSVDLRRVTLAIDVASVAANTTAEQTFTLTDVLVEDDILSLIKPSHSAGLGIVNSRVSADDTIAITYMNTTGSAIDPAEETYIIILLKNRI